MNRRASLPGVDALFGSSDPAHLHEPDDPSDAPQRPGLQAIVAESDAVRSVRAGLPADVPAPDPTVTALLRWLVATCLAHTVVEIGSAGGVSGAVLLEAMPERAVLTSIEPDAHAHGVATAAYRTVGAGSRVRSIHGEPEAVLPRLSDGGYDLVLWQTGVTDADDARSHAARLLRDGGVLVARGLVADGAGRTQAEALVSGLLDDETFEVAVLPVDGGVVLATRRGPDGPT
ncbi:MAG TPA: class I SAM-dependent methyltransferase [Egicoccus sp.]|nr:class I SAM-dependent methyltransferase [Egicoccus sp.]HSK24188.1 class I SAM-dependent methyltransferase [Egicoccus sp.]